MRKHKATFGFLYMIIILSKVGHTVNTVMDWLTYYGKKYIRVADLDNLYQLVHIEISNQRTSIRIKNEHYDIDLSEVTAVWVWHGDIQFEGLFKKDIEAFSSFKSVVVHLQSQMKIIYGFVENYLMSKPIIGHTQHQNANKLVVLNYAKQVGLDIPDTFISTNIPLIREFGAGRSLITKSISEAAFLADYDGRTILEGYTLAVPSEGLEEEINRPIFPSLVQERLQKRYEVRIFFLDGQCYPMAIFSQRDKQTELDFRRYNTVVPNKMMKCKIPEYLEQKIVNLMKLVGNNTGSLDFIKTTDGRYVFLEVNPVGQFGFVSDCCNYNLERVIAEKLCSFSEK